MSDKYEWSQQLNEIKIKYRNQGNTIVRLQDGHMKITSGEEVILEGKLLHPIINDSLYWYKEEEDVLVYVDKKKNEWWESLLVGSEKVDINNLAENNMTDFSLLDDEAREVIERMAYNNKE